MLLFGKNRRRPREPSAAQRVQPEGRVPEMGALEKLLYLRKYFFDQNDVAPEGVEAWSAPAAEASGDVRLGFVGDLMWIRNGWTEFLPASTLAALQAFDGLVGNLETVVSPRFPVKEFWPDLFDFNSRPELVRSFRGNNGASLFAALSFANNHSLDFEDEGAADTVRFLDQERIPHSGVRLAKEERRWTEFTRGGVRFGFYAATFGVNDPRRLARAQVTLETIPSLHPDDGPMPDLRGVVRALDEMKAAGVDVRLVSLHWGHEFDFFPSGRQREVARSLARAGADVIVGSHAHVPQPDEVIEVDDRRTLVLYGLGNFTTAMYTLPCRLARLAEVGFARLADGRVEWRGPLTHYFYNQASPRRLLPVGEAGLRADRLARLPTHIVAWFRAAGFCK